MPEPTAEPESVNPFTGTTYEASPEGWWTEYGGALDTASGVVFIPRSSTEVPPCPFPCDICRRKGRTHGHPDN